jgi:hypothetical protein
MAIGDLKDVLHRIKAKLYPSNLPQTEGGYWALTENEATLSVEDVCTTLVNRGGFPGKYEVLIDYVKQYLADFAYQLCDGYAVSTGYFSPHPNIGGIFSSDKEGHDHKNHPITIRFYTHAPMRELTGHITVDITGFADTNGYIANFTDVTTGAVNETVSGGDLFVIEGDKIRVAGDDPSCGVYFESPGLEQRIKVKENFAENHPSKIIGVVPMLIVPNSYRVVIVPQFSSGSRYLKEPRTVVSKFMLSAP